MYIIRVNYLTYRHCLCIILIKNMHAPVYFHSDICTGTHMHTCTKCSESRNLVRITKLLFKIGLAKLYCIQIIIGLSNNENIQLNI